jgi:hypothetical protein
LQQGQLDVLVVHSKNFDHLYAGGSPPGSNVTLYISTDGGANWASKLLPDAGTVTAIAVHPTNEQIIYVGGTQNSQGSVCRTSDGGETWTELGTSVFSAPITALVLDPVSPFRIYAASDDGVFRSEDSGATWTHCLTASTTAIAVNPALPNQVYAGGWAGVRKSVDFGSSWSDYSLGLIVKTIGALDFVKGTGTLVAATQGGGLYQIRPGGQCALVISATSGGTTTPAPGVYKHKPGTQVTITAAPALNYYFMGWSGDASGTTNPLTVTVDRDLAVRAEFQRTIYEPLDFKGVKKENRSLLFVEYVNVLNWRRNPANDAGLTYRLYLVEGTTPRLVASLDAATFEYRERGVDKAKAYTYRLIAIDPETGREGPPATVTIR